VADGSRHCGAVLFDPAHADRDPDVVFWGLLSGISANVIFVSLVHSLFHVPRMDERHADVPDCGGADHSNRYPFRLTLCLWPALLYPADRNTAQILVIMPIVVPVILIAVGVFSLYAKLGLNYTLTGIVIAHTALALPFVIVTVMSGLQNYDFDQELAARSMGASRAYALWTVTVPQVKFSIQTGAFLAFITSLDEVVISMLVSGGDNATITRRMFNSLRDQLDPTIAAISTCLIVVSVAALIGVQLIGRSKNADK
jgi:ABC-type spermidine/putrescine transport system permease subunit II